MSKNNLINVPLNGVLNLNINKAVTTDDPSIFNDLSGVYYGNSLAPFYVNTQESSGDSCQLFTYCDNDYYVENTGFGYRILDENNNILADRTNCMDMFKFNIRQLPSNAKYHNEGYLTVEGQQDLCCWYYHVDNNNNFCLHINNDITGTLPNGTNQIDAQILSNNNVVVAYTTDDYLCIQQYDINGNVVYNKCYGSQRHETYRTTTVVHPVSEVYTFCINSAFKCYGIICRETYNDFCCFPVTRLVCCNDIDYLNWQMSIATNGTNWAVQFANVCTPENAYEISLVCGGQLPEIEGYNEHCDEMNAKCLISYDIRMNRVVDVYVNTDYLFGISFDNNDCVSNKLYGPYLNEVLRLCRPSFRQYNSLQASLCVTMETYPGRQCESCYAQQSIVYNMLTNCITYAGRNICDDFYGCVCNVTHSCNPGYCCAYRNNATMPLGCLDLTNNNVCSCIQYTPLLTTQQQGNIYADTDTEILRCANIRVVNGLCLSRGETFCEACIICNDSTNRVYIVGSNSSTSQNSQQIFFDQADYNIGVTIGYGTYSGLVHKMRNIIPVNSICSLNIGKHNENPGVINVNSGAVCCAVCFPIPYKVTINNKYVVEWLPAFSSICYTGPSACLSNTYDPSIWCYGKLIGSSTLNWKQFGPYLINNSDSDFKVFDLEHEKWNTAFATGWNNSVIMKGRECNDEVINPTAWVTAVDNNYEITCELTPSVGCAVTIECLRGNTLCMYDLNNIYCTCLANSMPPIDFYFSTGEGISTASYYCTLTYNDYYYRENCLDNTVNYVSGNNIPVSLSDSYCCFATGIATVSNVISDINAPLMTSNNRTVWAYDASSTIDNISALFYISGTPYIVVKDTIYVASFVNGVIENTNQLAAVIGDMRFLTSTPFEALFWSQMNKTIYSFTGDRKVNPKQQATDIYSINFVHYNSLTQTTYISYINMNNESKLLAITSDNVEYFMPVNETINRVSESSDHISFNSENNTINIAYEKISDDYDLAPLYVSTSYIGSKDGMSVQKAPTWHIRLWEPNRQEVYLNMTGKAITNVGGVSKKKSLTIKPTDWDINNQVLVKYTPEYDAGVGNALDIETNGHIISIVMEQMDMNSVQHTSGIKSR